MQTYDFIFSIGQACSCTSILRICGLQNASYPFDWLYGNDLEGRTKIICSDFKNYIDQKDLEIVGTRDFPEPCYIVKSKHNNIIFNHDFPLSESIEHSYPMVYKKYQRRIQRLFDNIEKASKILAVYLEAPTEQSTPSNQEILQCQKMLIQKFPNKIFDILYIHNNSQFSEPHINYVSPHLVKIEYDYKDHNEGAAPYEVNYEKLKVLFNNYKLSSITSEPLATLQNLKKKPHGRYKLYYKIWKHFGKKLQKKEFI